MEAFPDPFAGPTHDGSLQKDFLNYIPPAIEDVSEEKDIPLPPVKSKGISMFVPEETKPSPTPPVKPWVRPTPIKHVDSVENTIPQVEEKIDYGPDVLIDNVTGLPFRRHVNKYGAGDSMKATKEALDKYRGKSDR